MQTNWYSYFSSFNLEIKQPNYLRIEPIGGHLIAYEEMYVTCQYTAEPNAPEEIVVDCHVRVIEGLESSIGTSYLQQFTVYAEHEYAELCVRLF